MRLVEKAEIFFEGQEVFRSLCRGQLFLGPWDEAANRGYTPESEQARVFTDGFRSAWEGWVIRTDEDGVIEGIDPLE